MRTIGIALMVMAWGLLLFTTFGAVLFANSHSQHDITITAEFTGRWTVALTAVIAAVGIVLSLVPLRRKEGWAWWTSLGVFVALLAARFASDPRCLVVLDPHQHGCHTFMIAIVIGIVGLVLAR